MSFQFKSGESVADGAARMVRKEIDDALEALAAPDRDEAVHEAREQLKKIRSVLRLVRDDLGTAVYRRENYAFRDMGKPLTEVRDAAVLCDTLDKLAEGCADRIPVGRVAEARAALRANRDAVSRRVLDEGRALKRVALQLEATRARVKDWADDVGGWPGVAKGVKRVYRSGREVFGAAADDPTVENLHEWRKQAKYLRHQLETLEPIWPEVLGGLVGQLHELGDVLGDDHDLAVLGERLAALPPASGNAEGTLFALLDEGRAELQRKALGLGEQLFCDRPGVFVDRLHACWDAWQSEASAVRA